MAFKNIKIYDKGYLDVGKGHSIYYELSGNPKGKPVLFVHGGPGGGFSSNDKRYFNPKLFNIITFDQRGSGKSKPFASIKNNITNDLVDDIKKLLDFFGIKKAYLFGGSWGSTLCLVYAIKYPETVLGMVIRGIFLGTKEENDYFVYDARSSFPEEWEKMISLVPNKNRNNILKYYYKMMRSKNKNIRNKYRLAWATYEFSVSKLIFSEKKLKEIFKEINFESFSLIELHYLVNNCFLPKHYILKNAYKLNGISTVIVQGRYDNVCNPYMAYLLHKRIPKSKLYYTLAGHASSDPETEKVLIREINRFVKLRPR
jgi:proline iminopeptidase